LNSSITLVSVLNILTCSKEEAGWATQPVRLLYTKDSAPLLCRESKHDSSVVQPLA